MSNIFRIKFFQAIFPTLLLSQWISGSIGAAGILQVSMTFGGADQGLGLLLLISSVLISIGGTFFITYYCIKINKKYLT